MRCRMKPAAERRAAAQNADYPTFAALVSLAAFCFFASLLFAFFFPISCFAFLSISMEKCHRVSGQKNQKKGEKKRAKNLISRPELVCLDMYALVDTRSASKKKVPVVSRITMPSQSVAWWNL